MRVGSDTTMLMLRRVGGVLLRLHAYEDRTSARKGGVTTSCVRDGTRNLVASATICLSISKKKIIMVLYIVSY